MAANFGQELTTCALCFVIKACNLFGSQQEREERKKEGKEDEHFH